MHRTLQHPGRTAAVVAASALVLAACSPGGDDGSADSTTVTFRLWDSQVAKAYEESFAAFDAEHDDIDVEIEVIPWEDYWTKLPQDVGSGDMADIFWTNSANFISYGENGDLIEIDDRFDEQRADWKQSVAEQYTWDDTLWGIPQLWDSVALYYNQALMDAAGVDPSTLRWDPTGSGDTLLPAAQKLTVDANGRSADDPDFDASRIDQFGFNAEVDLQASVLDFVGSGGGQWQDDTGTYVMDSPQTATAVQYLVDLINTHQVAPSAADTNGNSDKTRDLFIQGKLALYQSGPYRLKDIEESSDFEWGIAPILEGPEGPVSAVNGIIASGYAGTENEDATIEVLKWLGTAEGQRPIAEGGYAFPGVDGAEDAFVQYWSDQDVDIQPFIDAANGSVIYPPIGDRAQAGMTAVKTIMDEVFLGRTPVEKGLTDAQQAGNDATS